MVIFDLFCVSEKAVAREAWVIIVPDFLTLTCFKGALLFLPIFLPELVRLAFSDVSFQVNNNTIGRCSAPRACPHINTDHRIF